MNEMWDEFNSKCTRFFSLWGMPEIADHVVVEFSNRLHSSLGRSQVVTRRVRLNPLLKKSNEEFLDEVLCHELAHIAVYERIGRTAKPHGPEWIALVRQAGFEPRVRVIVGSELLPTHERRFEHLCPVCQTVRYAKRSMPRWRCRSCIEAGLEAHLLIRRIVKE